MAKDWIDGVYGREGYELADPYLYDQQLREKRKMEENTAVLELECTDKAKGRHRKESRGWFGGKR